MIAAHESLGGFEPGGNFGNWLRGIARNKALIGPRKGEKITVVAWKPHTREPNPPGSQGHEVIPKKGDTATFYLTGGGTEPFEPITPNGVAVDKAGKVE